MKNSLFFFFARLSFKIDNMKASREAEKGDILEPEVNHNFEADMYLEKLEQDNEKVSCALIGITNF